MPAQLDMLDMLTPQAPPASLAAQQPAPRAGALLIMSCSATKAPDSTTGDFHDLYTGPMWQQVNGSGIDRARVACVSALYGFLEPDHPAIVQPYERKMDEESAASICGTSNHVWRLAQCVLAHGSAFVVGGALYRRVAETAERLYPELAGRITYATGTYLEQRKQLGAWLRANA